MPYIIMTDSHTDLPYTLVDKWDLPLALMPYSLDGEEHFADMGRNRDYVNLFKAHVSIACTVVSGLSGAASEKWQRRTVYRVFFTAEQNHRQLARRRKRAYGALSRQAH